MLRGQLPQLPHQLRGYRQFVHDAILPADRCQVFGVEGSVVGGQAPNTAKQRDVLRVRSQSISSAAKWSSVFPLPHVVQTDMNGSSENRRQARRSRSRQDFGQSCQRPVRHAGLADSATSIGCSPPGPRPPLSTQGRRCVLRRQAAADCLRQSPSVVTVSCPPQRTAWLWWFGNARGARSACRADVLRTPALSSSSLARPKGPPKGCRRARSGLSPAP